MKSFTELFLAVRLLLLKPGPSNALMLVLRRLASVWLAAISVLLIARGGVVPERRS